MCSLPNAMWRAQNKLRKAAKAIQQSLTPISPIPAGQESWKGGGGEGRYHQKVKAV